MARRSDNCPEPTGKRWKVYYSNGKRTDYMVLYAPSKQAAMDAVDEDFRGTAYVVTHAEEA